MLPLLVSDLAYYVYYTAYRNSLTRTHLLFSCFNSRLTYYNFIKTVIRRLCIGYVVGFVETFTLYGRIKSILCSCSQLFGSIETVKYQNHFLYFDVVSFSEMSSYITTFLPAVDEDAKCDKSRCVFHNVKPYLSPHLSSSLVGMPVAAADDMWYDIRYISYCFCLS